MKRLLAVASIATLAAAAVFALIYFRGGSDIFLTLAITFATISYHFIMRLIVGASVNFAMHNHADLSKPWYQQKSWEKKLYRILRVKKWKGRVPTYEPDLFDLRKHTPDEVAQAMCQAEITHEVIIPLSFLPIFAAIWAGALPAFIITSVLASIMELFFIITQRFNRPRIISMLRRSKIKDQK